MPIAAQEMCSCFIRIFEIAGTNGEIRFLVFQKVILIFQKLFVIIRFSAELWEMFAPLISYQPAFYDISLLGGQGQGDCQHFALDVWAKMFDLFLQLWPFAQDKNAVLL